MAALTQRQQEIRVGLFVIAAIILMAVFAWIMGVINPLQRSISIFANYGFAGGIQTGSPVRISGMTVGKVTAVNFHPGRIDDEGTPIPVELKLSIAKDAAGAVKTDSEFFINLAGLIGEKYIEISPGSQEAAVVPDKGSVRGEDPPRIDQLISQSYGLAGEVRKLFNEKKGSITNTIELMLKLTENLNKLFDSVGSQKNVTAKKLDTLFSNLVDISNDLHVLTKKMNSPDGQRALDIMHTLLLRLEKIDENTVRTFVQKEGIKANISF